MEEQGRLAGLILASPILITVSWIILHLLGKLGALGHIVFTAALLLSIVLISASCFGAFQLAVEDRWIGAVASVAFSWLVARLSLGVLPEDLRAWFSPWVDYAVWGSAAAPTAILAIFAALSILPARREEPPPVPEVPEEDYFTRVVEAVEEFEPSMRYSSELGYHAELQGWLRARFSESRVEVWSGSSRPDIVVGSVAVEVKGPTTGRDLATVTDKLLRYSSYYDRIIVVLFDLQVSRRRLEEWLRGMERSFPNVKVILK